MCSNSTFDSTTNHLNSSPIFLNCLLLDLTVIELMSIVQCTEFGLKLQKIFEMWTSGGRGWSVNSDTPGRGEGRGGSKRTDILVDALYGWPLKERREARGKGQRRGYRLEKRE